MVYIILGTGFEEAEAIIPCDLLRRGGVEVKFAGIGGLEVTGGHGITVKADCTVHEADLASAQMLVLPGGLGGVASIRNCEVVMEQVKRAYDEGRYVAAICAAPTILAQLGITEGKKAACYPGMEDEMGTAQMCALGAVADGKVVTGKAAGTAFDFGLKLVEVLCGEEKARSIAKSVVYK